MGKYRRMEEFEAVRYTGENYDELSHITTVKLVMRNGRVALVDVWTGPKSDVHDGYETILKNDWLVKGVGYFKIVSDDQFQNMFVESV